MRCTVIGSVFYLNSLKRQKIRAFTSYCEVEMLIEPNRFAFYSFTPEQEEPSYKCLKTKIRCKMSDTFTNFHCIRSEAKHTSVQRQRYNDVQTNCRAVHLDH